MGHLFYAISSFVHHFIANGQFKIGLQSANAKLMLKSAIFLHVLPWELTDDLDLCYVTSGFVHHVIAISEFKLDLQFGNG